jgi:hypothetical protein
MGFETSGFWAETSLVCDGEDRSWFNGIVEEKQLIWMDASSFG